jgi:phosphohistidine swiveling domain-containing protein
MKRMIHTFSELRGEDRAAAGGKGGTLSRLFQAGYPVPEGFVIMPNAFDDESLRSDAWNEIQRQLAVMRKRNQNTAFAVRSSAVAEDSAYASFAGEFETVLDVHTDGAIRAAIHQVHNSRLAERVQVYSRAKGMSELQDIAIVVQRLVRADISGILFTADPVTGSARSMSGNYIFGFGEELVSGEVEPYTFTLSRPKGVYDGPADMKRFAKRLYGLAKKLEKDLGSPQDIEWAIADGKVYILQSRPITTLLGYDPVKEEWNSSFTGDYAWVSSEVFPDVMTPATWSIFKKFQNVDEETGIQGIGNICGRFYMNMSYAASMIKMIGKDHDYLVDYTKLTTGLDLDKIIVPYLPMTRWQLFRMVLPMMLTMLPKQAKLMKRHQIILAGSPVWCGQMRETIGKCQDKEELAQLWDQELWPKFWDLLQIQDKSNEDYFYPYIAARSKMIDLVGEEEAEVLLANLVGGSGELSSLDQLIGIQKLAEGQISKEEYARIAGHRPPMENEVSAPRLYEDPDWVEKRLAEYNKTPIDYRQMQDKKRQKFSMIWGEFSDRYPGQAKKIKAQLDKTAGAMEIREKTRTELTRSLGVFRSWFLKAGEMTGVHEDIFYLQNDEAQMLLRGDLSWIAVIPPRKQAYQHHLELPPLPMMVSGRFDPYTWANDPDKRLDYYDSHVPSSKVEMSDQIKGLPGSAGQVEGIVRIIYSPEESDKFKPGEILVASSTNVGWTPLFPRAAAVITDIGAPLSHAAIVARELGIPAVVGTSNGTTVLTTGDRVRVDGSHGSVEILEKVSAP